MKISSKASKNIEVFFRVLTIAVILLGITTRIVVFLQNRNLFIDEANLARNIYERNVFQLATPLSYEQYAPPVFLWMLKLFTSIFGYSEYAYRLYPLLASIAVLYVMYLVLKDLTSFRSLWYPLALLAVSYIMIRYSSELKQYMTDILVVLSVILLALRTNINRISAAKFLLTWFIAGSIAIWAAMPSVFVLAGVGCYYLVNSVREREYNKIPFIALTGVLWVLQFLLYYFLILKPQIESSYLQNFHQDWFLYATPANLDEWKHNFSVLKNLLEEAGGYTFVTLSFNFLLLIIGTIFFVKNSTKHLLITIPLLAVICAAALNQYSLIPRVALFTMPLMLILVGYGMEQLMRTRFAAVSVIVCLLAAIGIKNHSMVNMMWNPSEVEEITDAMDFAVDHGIKSGNQLYLHNGARPAFIYYTQIHPDKAKWKKIADAHLLWWDADYDHHARTAPALSSFIFTSVSPDDLAGCRATIEKYNTQTAALEKQGCHVFIYRK